MQPIGIRNQMYTLLNTKQSPSINFITRFMWLKMPSPKAITLSTFRCIILNDFWQLKYNNLFKTLQLQQPMKLFGLIQIICYNHGCTQVCQNLDSYFYTRFQYFVLPDGFQRMGFAWKRSSLSRPSTTRRPRTTAKPSVDNSLNPPTSWSPTPSPSCWPTGRTSPRTRSGLVRIDSMIFPLENWLFNFCKGTFLFKPFFHTYVLKIRQLFWDSLRQSNANTR